MLSNKDVPNILYRNYR